MQRRTGSGIAAAAALAAALLGAATGAVGASSDDTTEPPATESMAADSMADAEWTQVVLGEECQCADGAEYSIFVREANPDKVLFFLEGGGACFDEGTCAFTDASTYDYDIGDDENPAQIGGVFDLDNPDNPFADYSMVYVPYCTGDVHLGDNTVEFSSELTVHFNGATNGAAAIDYLTENFGDAEQVVVLGESAGAVAAPLYGGLVSDVMSDAQITVLADGSGGYASVPDVNVRLGELWGVLNALPDWEETKDIAPEEWSIPGLWVFAGNHDPDIVMARFDYAYDGTQRLFSGVVGIDASDLLGLIDANDEFVEAGGVDRASYTAPGDQHTLVRKDDFYTMEVDGVALPDWVRALIDGDEVADVRCESCEAAAAPATTG